MRLRTPRPHRHGAARHDAVEAPWRRAASARVIAAGALSLLGACAGPQQQTPSAPAAGIDAGATVTATPAAPPAVELPPGTRRCVDAGLAPIAAKRGCETGMPVISGRFMLLPRACKLEFEGRAVLRHTVEIREARTGKRVGQASLPPTDAGGAPARVGGLIGGMYPLYVFDGGVALVHTGVRKLELALQPEGAKIAGLARGGEVLAVAEQLPADKTFPAGSISWTVLDFGAGIELGTLQVAGKDLLGLGVGAAADGKVPVWLRLRGRDAVADLVASLASKGAAEGQPTPAIKARAAAPSDHGDVGASGWKAGPRQPGRCAVLTGHDAVLPHALAVRVGDEVVMPSTATEIIGARGCGAAVWADDSHELAWGWIDGDAGALPALRALRCGP